MKYPRLLYFIWLVPGILLFLAVQQAAVYYSVIDTYQNGTSYNAEIMKYEMKRIATQTSGYMILKFEMKDGSTHQQKIAIPIEMGGMVSDSNMLPIRYQEDSLVDIVIIPTYDTQKGLILTNLAMAVVGLLLTLYAAYLVHRYVRRQLASGNDKIVIERVDHEQ